MNKAKKYFYWIAASIFLISLLVLFIKLIKSSALILNSDQRGVEILNTIPVYPGAELNGEFKTSYPDSTPSVSRTYSSSGYSEDIFSYYQSAIPESGWKIIEKWDKDDPLVVKVLTIQKENWKASILIDSSGQFVLRVFL